jgi:hypothetical protein
VGEGRAKGGAQRLEIDRGREQRAPTAMPTEGEPWLEPRLIRRVLLVEGAQKPVPVSNAQSTVANQGESFLADERSEGL